MAAVTAAVAQGEISVTEAADVSRPVETYVRSVKVNDLEKRRRAIEEAVK